MCENLIESNRGTTPVITGTQVTVEAILRELATGETVDDVLAVHPELSREAVLAALSFAAEKVHVSESLSPSAPPPEAGDFVPLTPLAKELWEFRKAAIMEALERGESLLHSWEDVRREVRERRGERDAGADL